MQAVVRALCHYYLVVTNIIDRAFFDHNVSYCRKLWKLCSNFAAHNYPKRGFDLLTMALHYAVFSYVDFSSIGVEIITKKHESLKKNLEYNKLYIVTFDLVKSCLIFFANFHLYPSQSFVSAEESVGLPLEQKELEPKEIPGCQEEGSNSGTFGSHLRLEDNIHLSLIPCACLCVSSCLAVSGA